MNWFGIRELGFRLAGMPLEEGNDFPLRVNFLRQVGLKLSVAGITYTEKRFIRGTIEDLQMAIFHAMSLAQRAEVRHFPEHFNSTKVTFRAGLLPSRPNPFAFSYGLSSSTPEPFPDARIKGIRPCLPPPPAKNCEKS